MWDLSFWKAATERAIKTFAQTIVALIGTAAVSIVDLDWGQMLGVAATATLLSFATSVISNNIGENNGPSLVNEEVLPVEPK